MDASLRLADVGWWISISLNEKIRNLIAQANKTKDGTIPLTAVPGLHSYFVLILSTLPFAFLCLGIALGQSHISGFFLWNSLACIILGSPLLFVLVQLQDAFPKTPSVGFPAAPVLEADPKIGPATKCRAFGLEQDWLWRGWKIHYTCLENPQNQVPVILLHGFGASIGHWRHNLPELARHHNVYAIDLLGFGASAKPETPYTIQLWSEQVYEFWQTFIGVPAVLVGNSIGSLTCLTAAATYPEMTRGVAMISLPDTLAHTAKIPKVLRPMVRQVEKLLTSPLFLQPLFHILRQPWVVRHWIGFAYACKEPITDELLEILTAPARCQEAARAFSALIKAMLNPRFSPHVPSILRNLQIPSLLLWGRQDRMIPVALAHRLITYNSDLKLIELENAGHCAHDECPERVNLELLSWIQQEVL